MDFRRFGRTGLSVSVGGIGAGGASRLGISTGSSEEEAIALVQRAIDLGVNYFDTAANYGNEEVLGRALEGHRDEVVISSKLSPRQEDGSLLDPAGLRRGLEVALGKLRTDVVDVYHLHRPMIEDYDHCRDVLVPELEALRAEGKLRFTGISGTTGADPTHATLHRALADDAFDVMMCGFNPFNQGAREAVFEGAMQRDVAIEIMGAAKAPFSRPAEFQAEIARLVEAGALDGEDLDPAEPLAFLEGSGAGTLTEACYRFAAYEPGAHVVLMGTGNPVHLEENVRALQDGPLPGPVRDRLVSLFSHLSGATAA